MDTTTMTRPAAGTAIDEAVDLEQPVDRLADLVERLLVSADEFVCSLRFEEAEALAEALDAGHRTRTAARLMHRWVLTEPDWGEDERHAELLDHWLALSVRPDGSARGVIGRFRSPRLMRRGERSA
jgi:hypothetical protein